MVELLKGVQLRMIIFRFLPQKATERQVQVPCSPSLIPSPHQGYGVGGSWIHFGRAEGTGERLPDHDLDTRFLGNVADSTWFLANHTYR